MPSEFKRIRFLFQEHLKDTNPMRGLCCYIRTEASSNRNCRARNGPTVWFVDVRIAHP